MSPMSCSLILFTFIIFRYPYAYISLISLPLSLLAIWLHHIHNDT
jgi:hypothetical protein